MRPFRQRQIHPYPHGKPTRNPDGKKLHFYDKDLRQVTVRPAGEAIQATPAAVLFGFGDLNDSFRLSELGVHGRGQV